MLIVFSNLFSYEKIFLRISDLFSHAQRPLADYLVLYSPESGMFEYIRPNFQARFSRKLSREQENCIL